MASSKLDEKRGYNVEKQGKGNQLGARFLANCFFHDALRRRVGGIWETFALDSLRKTRKGRTEESGGG